MRVCLIGDLIEIGCLLIESIGMPSLDSVIATSNRDMSEHDYVFWCFKRRMRHSLTVVVIDLF
jgi:hypothetical protein